MNHTRNTQDICNIHGAQTACITQTAHSDQTAHSVQTAHGAQTACITQTAHSDQAAHSGQTANIAQTAQSARNARSAGNACDARSTRVIYLDNAATTRLLPEALEAMLPYLGEDFGNPSAIYRSGMRSRSAIDRSRDRIAETLGASPSEIFFTSGGTESDNWALDYCLQKRCGLVTTAIEHHAVLRGAKAISEANLPVRIVPVEENGTVDPGKIREAVTEEIGLVSVMAANNEIGTIQDIRAISAIAHERGALMHTDAVQAYGHIPLDVRRDGIDLLSASAHKLHGPKGVGLLYIRSGVRLGPFVKGGAQERGFRAGTENVAGIVGFGVAAAHMHGHMEAYSARETELRDYAFSKIREYLPGARILGDERKRLPNNICILLPRGDGERLLIALDLMGICASSGSACAAGSLDPSHVLLALGLPYDDAFRELRLTLSHETTREELDTAIDIIASLV